ncbi:MAG: hypothetical protein ABIP20_16495 [Chthoniobacteraceae bacterium]
MKSPLTTLLAAALLLAGCATQPKEQLAAARAAGVSPGVMQKLEHSGRLSPADIIELRRRRVNDAIALRQLDIAGVDYVVDKDVVRQLRKGGVSETVITAATNAGERFVEQYRQPYVSAWVSPGGYPYSGYPYSGYPYSGYPYEPYYYGSVRPYRQYDSYPQYHRHRGASDFLPPGPHLLFR